MVWLTPVTPEEYIVAVHECGHIAGYLHYNWKFGPVRMWQGENGRPQGSVISPRGRYDPLGQAICCLCGPASEERLTGVPIPDQTGSRPDIVMALNALARARFIEPLDLESVLPFTRLLIEEQWPTIEHLACALIRHRELDYEQVLELL
jgi:hypothetical protein